MYTRCRRYADFFSAGYAAKSFPGHHCNVVCGLATAVALSAAVVLSAGGCATGSSELYGSTVQYVEDAGSDSDSPGRRILRYSPSSSDRRTFEIPVGFVRRPAPARTTVRGVERGFRYTPQRITCDQAWEIAEKVGVEAGIDPGILFGIMRVESAFAVNAISRAGAVGLMQVMPGPARSLRCGDRLDPLENARCGVVILTRFLRYFDNDLILGLSAYNAGYAIPRKARKKRVIPRNFSYPEKVMRVRGKFLRWGCVPWESRR